MKFSVLVQITFALLCAVSCSPEISYSEQYDEYNYLTQPYGYLSCICPSGKAFVSYSPERLNKILQEIQVTNLCMKSVDDEVCEFVSTCDFCSLETQQCSAGRYCTKRRLQIENPGGLNGLYEETIDLHHFGKEDTATTCRYPHIYTADVLCHKSRTTIICEERCNLGFTLAEGIYRKISCNYKRNKWQPWEFEECKRYMDPSLKFVAPGKSHCWSSTPWELPLCEIDCEATNRAPAVPMKNYTLTTLGIWNPPLPPCIEPKHQYTSLVKSPKIRYHSDTSILTINHSEEDDYLLY